MDRLRAMELFLSISQTRNFSETARRFGISATGVSRMITDIEDELKVKLLLRSTRQVALTESRPGIRAPAGGHPVAHQRAAGQHHRHQQRAAGPAAGAFAHDVRPGRAAAPDRAFRKLYPEIHIELTLGEAAADLRRSQIDIDFRISPPVEAGVKRRMLFQSDRYLVAAPAYLAGKPALAGARRHPGARVPGLPTARRRIHLAVQAAGADQRHRLQAPPCQQQRHRLAGARAPGRRPGAARRLHRAQRPAPGPAGPRCWTTIASATRASTRACTPPSSTPPSSRQDPPVPGFRGRARGGPELRFSAHSKAAGLDAPPAA